MKERTNNTVGKNKQQEVLWKNVMKENYIKSWKQAVQIRNRICVKQGDITEVGKVTERAEQN